MMDVVDHVCHVNSLAFHSTFNTFASAGSDGTVAIWDRKRVAVGVSCTWDEEAVGFKANPVDIMVGC